MKYFPNRDYHIKNISQAKIAFSFLYSTVQYKLRVSGGKSGNQFIFPTVKSINRLIEDKKNSKEYRDELVELVNTIDKLDIKPDVITPLTSVELVNLRPYQVEDVKTLNQLVNSANFSEQRTGKTPTALMLANHLNLPTLIVCPPSLSLLSWKPQIEKWINQTPLTLFKTKITKGVIKHIAMSKKERYETYCEFFKSNKAQFLIVSKDTWKTDYEMVIDTISNFMLIVDEAHFLKAYKSKTKTTQQAKSVILTSQKATRTLLLTGTPTTNHPSDIFGILHTLNPKRFKSYYDFVDYFWGFDNWKNPKQRYRFSEFEEEISDITKKYSVMHKQREIMKWLPEVQREVVRLPMKSIQAKQYAEMFIYFENDEEMTQNILTQIIKLRQLSNGVAHSVEKSWNGVPKINSNKIEWLLNYIKENPNDKIMVLTNYSNKTIPLITQELAEFSPQVIVGSTPQNDRLNIVESIQNGNERILVANIACLKEGITLDKLDTIIFFDRSFSPSDNSQVEARFMPTTEGELRDKQKLIIDLVSLCPVDITSAELKSVRSRLEHTLTDEKILELLNQKIDITEYINNLGRKKEK